MDHDIDDMTCEGGCGARSKWAQASAAINSLVTRTESDRELGARVVPGWQPLQPELGPADPGRPRNANAIGAGSRGARTLVAV